MALTTWNCCKDEAYEREDTGPARSQEDIGMLHGGKHLEWCREWQKDNSRTTMEKMTVEIAERRECVSTRFKCCCAKLSTRTVRPDVTTLVTGSTGQRVTQTRNCAATSDRREGTKLWFNAKEEKTGDKGSIGFLHNTTQHVVVTEIL